MVARDRVPSEYIARWWLHEELLGTRRGLTPEQVEARTRGLAAREARELAATLSAPLLPRQVRFRALLNECTAVFRRALQDVPDGRVPTDWSMLSRTIALLEADRLERAAAAAPDNLAIALLDRREG